MMITATEDNLIQWLRRNAKIMLHITVNVMPSGAQFIYPQGLVLVHICETHTVSLSLCSVQLSIY